VGLAAYLMGLVLQSLRVQNIDYLKEIISFLSSFLSLLPSLLFSSLPL
jgi:hypothetical protein